MVDEEATWNPEDRAADKGSIPAGEEAPAPQRRRARSRSEKPGQDVTSSDPMKEQKNEREDNLGPPEDEENFPEPASSRRVSRNRKKDAKIKKEESLQDTPGPATEKNDASEAGAGLLKFKKCMKVLAPRLVTVSLVLAAVFVVVEARILPLPRKSYTLTPAVVPARNTIKICPAPPRLLDTATGIDPKFSPVPREARAQVKAFAQAEALDGPSDLSVKDLSGKSIAASDGGDKPYPMLNSGNRLESTTKVEARSSGAEYAEVASAFSYASASGDIQGLSVASCQTPKNELWISGVATSLGYTSILTVTNPGRGSATVNITLYDEQGVISSAAASQLVVEAQSERSVMLAALGRSKDRLTLKVSSSAGAITATVAQNKMRGLSPGGVDILTPEEEPAARQIIPAYRQEDPKDIRELSSQFGYQDATSLLQVTAPYEDAKVRLRVYGSDGEQKSEEKEFGVQAHTVREVPLAELPEGTYTLELTSTGGDIVAAARMISGKRGQSMDFAWAHGIKAAAPQHIFALSNPLDTTISLFAANGQGRAELTPVTADGFAKERQDFNIPERKVVSFRPGDYGGDVVGFMVGGIEGAVFIAESVAIESKHQVSWMEVPRPAQEQGGIPVVLQY